MLSLTPEPVEFVATLIYVSLHLSCFCLLLSLCLWTDGLAFFNHPSLLLLQAS
jgi:hypothetical protein